MDLLINILWVFWIFSLAGWVVHFVPRTIKKRKAVNPGFITLPFLPSYGLGAVACYLLLSRIENLFMAFFASMIVLTVAKYLVSMLFERAFGFKWHDQSKKFLNINGYVSAWEPPIYGIAALLTKIYLLRPLTDFIDSVPDLAALLIGAILTGLIISDFLISCFIVLHLRRNLRQMKNISSLLDDNNSDKSDDELLAQYEKKMIQSKRFRRRLVNAFPDMESVNYEKQLADMKIRFDIIREHNDEVYDNKIERPEDRPFAYGLSFTKLFWLFFVGSFFGTILETIWAYFTLGHFEMRVGMVWGPFIPVYGGGAVAITLCLYKLHKSGDIIIYLASAVIGATFEYFCSYFLESCFGIISWDYSNTPFNIDGRTNLTFAMIWGLLGLAWLRYIYPIFSRLVEKIPKKIGNYLTIALVIFMIINSVMSVAAVYRMRQRAENKPAENAFTQWIDGTFNDDYMSFIFPHMATPEEWQEALAK